MSYRPAIAAATCWPLAGATPRIRTLAMRSVSGETVKYNAAIQTINPAPVYPANAALPGSNGDKGQKAVERYRNDEVKEVETMTTDRRWRRRRLGLWRRTEDANA